MNLLRGGYCIIAEEQLESWKLNERNTETQSNAAKYRQSNGSSIS
jgi:hypothetical protein